MLLNPRLDPIFLLFMTGALIVAISAHEANHALVATALGDDTPRRFGRLSLNPFRHIQIGMLIVFVLLGVGWGSTPVTPSKLRPSPRTGSAIVAVSGPLANLALALLLSLPFRAHWNLPDFVLQFLLIAISLNVLLFVFNLIPFPPLDGFTVLLGVLPSTLAAALKRIERFGVYLIPALFLLSFFGFNILAPFLYSAMAFVSRGLGLPSLR